MSSERTIPPTIVRGTVIQSSDSRQQYRERLARVTLDSMVHFVGLLDTKGIVLEINKGALDATGIKLSDVEGKPLWTTWWWQISEESNTKLRGAIARAAQGEFVRWDTSIYARTGGKETILIDVSLSPVWDDQGNVVFLCVEGRDVTDRKDELESLKAGEIAQAKLAAIIDSSDDAIVSKRLDGTITSWNRAAEALFGYTAEEAVGQHILLIVPPERHEEERTILARLRAGQKIDHFETQRLHKNGTYIDISLSVSPIKDSSGQIIGAAKIARDITDRKRMEQDRESLLEAERKARETAQRIIALKDEFLATLSHELRTPLSAIMGWAQLLSSGKMDTSEFVEVGRVIERNARTQKQLIDDLLDMSRIISGKLRLDLQRISPIDFVEAAIETVLPTAEAKNIRIEKMLDPAAGPIAGDAARLQQVVWNLLSNAVKFTPKGGRIQVLLERVNSHLELTVADNGLGIEPEFLPRLFERFRQADATTTRRHGGLGLGLAIVKQITELHGGSVHARSNGPGTGATIVIHLPALVLHAPDDDEERLHPRSSWVPSERQIVDLSDLKVLVVDDEPDARELVRRLLAECGAIVKAVESAAAAISALAADIPDVLVSDIGMPDIDGYELLRRVRTYEGGAQIPAIALTAFARSEDRTRAMRAGYIAHVAKPVEPAELLATVAVVTGRPTAG